MLQLSLGSCVARTHAVEGIIRMLPMSGSGDYGTIHTAMIICICNCREHTLDVLSLRRPRDRLHFHSAATPAAQLCVMGCAKPHLLSPPLQRKHATSNQFHKCGVMGTITRIQ